MNSEPELKPILNQIIKQEYSKDINDWIVGAKPQEKKGLYLIGKIMSHKGEGIFAEEKKVSIDINQCNFKSALHRYKGNKDNSTYKTHFSGGSNFIYKNIFSERDISKLNYSEVLKPQAVTYISSWLNKESVEKYKDHVLDFLRSFFSTVQNNKTFLTSNKYMYKVYQKHEKYTIDRTFGNEPKTSKIVPNITVEDLD